MSTIVAKNIGRIELDLIFEAVVVVEALTKKAVEARMEEAVEARMEEAVEARMEEAVEARMEEAVEARMQEAVVVASIGALLAALTVVVLVVASPAPLVPPDTTTSCRPRRVPARRSFQTARYSCRLRSACDAKCRVTLKLPIASRMNSRTLGFISMIIQMNTGRMESDFLYEAALVVKARMKEAVKARREEAVVVRFEGENAGLEATVQHCLQSSFMHFFI